MANLYDRFLLPRLVHFACSLEPQMRQRQKIVPLATGTVLEIGFGTGLNLPFYDRSKVERVVALEPADAMWARARRTVQAVAMPVERIASSAERIQLPDCSIDTVVVTYALCTIPDVEAALLEMKRVLRNDGRLLFCEHGAAPDPAVLRWQNRINPLWKLFAGGCNLNRPMPKLIEAAGFQPVELDAKYVPGWRPGSFNYWGVAVRRPLLQSRMRASEADSTLAAQSSTRIDSGWRELCRRGCSEHGNASRDPPRVSEAVRGCSALAE